MDATDEPQAEHRAQPPLAYQMKQTYYVPPHTIDDQFAEHLDFVFADNVPVWERNSAMRKVSMAACIVNGILFTGTRHFCPVMQMQIKHAGVDLSGRYHDCCNDQGFVDQWGIYMSRKEAFDVAEAAGQIDRTYSGRTLFSECYI